MGRSTHDTSSRTTRRLTDVSVPKIRKIVHKVMTKHCDDKFYEKIDLIKKVLRKLKVYPVGCSETSKIRNMINRWINTNKPTDEDNDDKKDLKIGIAKINESKNPTDEQQTVALSETTGKSAQADSAQVVPVFLTLERIDEQQMVTIDQSIKESDVVPTTTIPTNTTEKVSVSVKDTSKLKKEKIIPLIDLTILDADKIKKEPVENDEGSNAALDSQVENVMPGCNYNYYYSYPYNGYNYNYDYKYHNYWYAYYNGYINYDQQYNTNTNCNGVYTAAPVSYTNNNV